MAEVAGITVPPLSTIDVNGGVVAPNDLVNYELNVANVGNDTTEFFIPGTPSVVEPASATAVQITGYIQPNGTRVNFPESSRWKFPRRRDSSGLLLGRQRSDND